MSLPAADNSLQPPAPLPPDEEPDEQVESTQEVELVDVPVRTDSRGRPLETMKTSREAAQHWDSRLWRRK
jgi:hypothetical protein